MIANSSILSIPPYISISWKHVLMLSIEDGLLKVDIVGGKIVSIPELSGSDIEKIFQCHADSEGKKDRLKEKRFDMSGPAPNFPGGGFSLELGPAGMSMPPGVELPPGVDAGSFTGMMQHDPNQKDAQNLPDEILSKIAGVAKVLGIDTDAFNLPDLDPDCNCPYCQIARAIHGKPSPNKIPDIGESDDAEHVSPGELKFREWDVSQIGSKLYAVSDPFDKSEHYQVFLGEPIGCTCGKNNCDHIIAVLNS